MLKGLSKRKAGTLYSIGLGNAVVNKEKWIPCCRTSQCLHYGNEQCKSPRGVANKSIGISCATELFWGFFSKAPSWGSVFMELFLGKTAAWWCTPQGPHLPVRSSTKEELEPVYQMNKWTHFLETYRDQSSIALLKTPQCPLVNLRIKSCLFPWGARPMWHSQPSLHASLTSPPGRPWGAGWAC